jgi:type I restriction enzyme S subunit
MIKANFAKYNNYKNSCVDWLGNIPEHWEVVRNKEIFTERSVLSSTGEETLLTVSHITGVTPRSEKNVNMFMAETMEGYKICYEGDLIINTMWAWMGALGTSNYFGICSPSYNVYLPKKGIPYYHKFFDYLFRTPNAIVEMTRNSKGIVSSRLRLYAKDFFQIKTVLPSFEEQKAIARYLDEKTELIDRKINLLTQKADRYKELKRSLINKTVTCGLDPSVPMKNSGIEWLGDIPEHWEVKPLKSLVWKIGSGKTPKGGAEVYSKSGIVFIRSQNVHFDGLRLEDVVYIDQSIDNQMASTRVFPSDILLNITGASLGRCTIVPDKFVPANVNQHVCIIRPITNFINPAFLNRVISSDIIQRQIFSTEYGTSREGLTFAQIRNFIVGFPQDIMEQKAIAHYLDEKTSKIDQIIETINNQIEKLQELRKTLINDIVTGKIKVI